MTYPNHLTAGINTAKMSGPAHHIENISFKLDPDQIALAVAFRASQPLTIDPAGNILDTAGQPIAGITVHADMAPIYTCRCSINGLARLSQDDRIISFSLSKPVGPAAAPGLHP